jgi:hypothetical protein
MLIRCRVVIEEERRRTLEGWGGEGDDDGSGAEKIFISLITIRNDD